eukprot:gb/GEZN01023461.1/.p1 GENE.gb/GEZN01023461.1/~~gb/GEZN01023461.1/.p1  ORF type:complete len:165 (-),score=46.45 gb/GEZN01023461.1/:67-561(-)
MEDDDGDLLPELKADEELDGECCKCFCIEPVRSAGCHHELCSDCWVEFLNNNKGQKSLICPDPETKCRKKVPPSLIEEFAIKIDATEDYEAVVPSPGVEKSVGEPSEPVTASADAEESEASAAAAATEEAPEEKKIKKKKGKASPKKKVSTSGKGKKKKKKKAT